MRVRRIVAVVALASRPPWSALGPAVQVRLNAITGRTSQALLAANTPEGVRERTVLQAGVDLLDDRVTPMGLSERDEHRPVASSRIAFGYSIVVHAWAGTCVIAAFTAGSLRTVTDTSAPAVIAVPTVAYP